MKTKSLPAALVLAVTVGWTVAEVSAQARRDPAPTPRQQKATDEIMEYFARTTERLAKKALAEVETLEDWQKARETIREQVLEMLGLWPLPEKTDLKPTITGTVEHDDFVVEKLHFQSAPGLYVTGNFYRPKEVTEPLPTVLYLCGHGRVKKGDVSFGNKASYQHHPAWFVRNGYCSLVIDTLQLGEIEGMHHGTYRYDRWWWLSRGYTPAGVEAWNAVRAMDYLETRPEVDIKRVGVTGRSGGGTYTWWLSAIDDRPLCLVPVAGITDLQNHVVDGCISGHCDCNYYGNLYGFDVTVYAALAAPRPLLLSNSDKDRIFPLDGVIRIHSTLRRIYDLYDAGDKLGLLITEGPHQDTQDLRTPCFRWMNRWLRDTDELLQFPAEKLFEPEDLKVFETLPEDEKNTTIDETFVPVAKTPKTPESLTEWDGQKEAFLETLRKKSFAGWPSDPPSLDVRAGEPATADGLTLTAVDYRSDENLRFTAYVLQGEHEAPAELLVVTAVDDGGWKNWLSSLPEELRAAVDPESDVKADADAIESNRKMLQANNWAMAVVAPRGIGPNQWDQRTRENTQILRRFFVLGKTADEGRVWDVRRAIQALCQQPQFSESRVWVQGKDSAAGIALYAGLFEPNVQRFDLHKPASTHHDGPYLLNVLRHMDLPQSAASAFPRQVIMYDAEPAEWEWTRAVSKLYASEEKSPLQFRSTR